MRAADVMTERVLRVRPETTVLDIATTLSERQISALPVVDAKAGWSGSSPKAI